MDLEIRNLIEFLSSQKHIKVLMENDTGLPYIYMLYGPSWIPVLCYVLKFVSNSKDEEIYDATLIKTIHLLNDSAPKWAYEKALDHKEKKLFTEILLLNFAPHLQKYFKVPTKVPSLPPFNPNEILAAFLDFLLQIWNTQGHRKYDEIYSEQTEVYEEAWPKKLKHELHEHELHLVKRLLYMCDSCDEKGHGWSYYCKHCDFDLHPTCGLKSNDDNEEGDIDEEEDEIWTIPVDVHKNQMYALVHTELKFLLTFLGDVPFQCCTNHGILLQENLSTILAEFEILANEAGHFTLFFILAPHPGRFTEFNAVINKLMDKIELLKRSINKYCITFSELIPMHVIISPTVTRPIDSRFIVDSLLEDLESLINKQFHFTVDVDLKDQIEVLYKELELSSYFLKHTKSVSRETNNGLLKECFIAIREIAYEAEYLINSYIVGNIPLWYLHFRLPSVIQKLKLSRSRREEFKINDDDVLHVTKYFIGKVSPQPSGTTTAVVEDHLVGVQEIKNEILDKLTGNSKALKIISLVGMPGLGKTTLAKNLFDCSSVQNHFDRRAWCVISQNYVKRKLFLEISMALVSEEEKQELPDIEDEYLGIKIHQNLYNRRYIIIIDDIWTSSTWDDMRMYFPDDNNGSRIMFTSRIKDATPVGSIFPTLPLLSEADSMCLLVKKVFLNESCPPQLLGIGNKIARRCNGLPLALVAIAGILANLDMEESSWTKVERDLHKFMLDVQGSCMKILEFSYEHLSDNLKMCFLYLGTFPEDSKIPIGKILALWIAEGFIERVQAKSPEDVAKQYLHDLINRSLVFIVKRKHDGGAKACGLHDLLRDLCLQKVDEQNFMKSTKKPFSMYMRHHRLRVDCDKLSRHFGLYCRSSSGNFSAGSSCFLQMPLHRVIDLSLHKGVIELEGIDRLVHLRYLCAPARGLSPQSASNLVNLEILDVLLFSDCGDGIALSIILNMVKLKHLKIRSWEVRIINDCNSCKHLNLESISRIRIDNLEDEKFLIYCPHIRKLKCKCYGSQFPHIGSLTELETLDIWFADQLENIDLTRAIFPSTIKKLTLGNAGLQWDEMSIIGRLPNLQVLRLFGHNFVGEEWETRDGEFQKLKFLKLEENSSLERWITCSEHFPELQCLVLQYCYSLQDIPSDLGNIATLHTIKMKGCTYRINKCAVQIEQEQHENGNKELEVIIASSNWAKKTLVREYSEMKGLFRFLNDSCTNSSSELLNVMKSFGINPSEDELQMLINEVIGNIEFPEFLDLIDEIRVPYSDNMIQKAFKLFDNTLDGGFIDVSILYYELREIGQEVSWEEVEKMVREADIDGDGKLNQLEFSKLISTIDFPRPYDLRTVLLLLQIPGQDELQELKDAFSVYNFDGDGCITTNEIPSLVRRIEENATKAQLHDMINKVDLHGNNGTLDFPHFLYLHAITFQEEEYSKKFEIFDKDQNGFISAADLHGITFNSKEVTDEKVEEMIRESDVDGDGQLNFHEFVKFITKLWLN